MYGTQAVEAVVVEPKALPQVAQVEVGAVEKEATVMPLMLFQEQQIPVAEAVVVVGAIHLPMAPAAPA
ncbi:hypothetical protein Barb6XT_00108 [Bacteroidales bacterium Barb6XT]|nr:hypothetical protein Barb6XT_00108 [Bacteroidales bacterium Barb6XT]